MDPVYISELPSNSLDVPLMDKDNNNDNNNKEHPSIQKITSLFDILHFQSDLDETNNSETSWKNTWRQRMYYYIPILDWLPKYKFCSKDIINDMIAGVTVSMMLLPQCIAYSRISGTHVFHGLLTGCLPPFIYLFFGTSKHISVAIDSVLSLVYASYLPTLVQQAHSDQPYYIPTADDISEQALVLAFVTGIIILAFGIFRIGYIWTILASSTISGFMCAIALTIIATQTNDALGIPNCQGHDCPPFTFAGFYYYTFSNIHLCHLPTVLCSILLWLLLFFIGMLKERNPSLAAFPHIFLLVAFGTAASWFFDFESMGIAITGEAKTTNKYILFSLPAIHSFSSFLDTLQPAFVVATIAVSIHFVTGKFFAAKYHYLMSNNRELVALGLTNTIVPFFGGFSGTAGLSRSKLNTIAGATSQFAGFFSGCVILIFSFFIMPLLSALPKNIIAGVVIYAVHFLIFEAYSTCSFLYQMSAYFDVLIFWVVVISTLILGPNAGIFIAFGVSLLFLVKQNSQPRITVLTKTSDNRIVPFHRDNPNLSLIDHVMIAKLEGSLFFANCQQLSDSLQRIEIFGDTRLHWKASDRLTTSLKCVILDLSSVEKIDGSGYIILITMIQDYQLRNIYVIIVGYIQDKNITKLQQECDFTVCKDVHGALKYFDNYKMKRPEIIIDSPRNINR